MRARRALAAVGTALTVIVALTGCAAASVPPGPGNSEPVAAPSVTAEGAGPISVLSVIDGDTIETTAGTVRIIGIDTPERGECGDDAASAALTDVLAVGGTVSLELPPGQNDQDRYGRLIRYVTTDAGLDLGLIQLQAGNVVARYDSLDEYPAHPRETEYHAAQIATFGPDGSVVTSACQAVAQVPQAGDRWWEQYTSCTKLKKNDVGHPTGPFHRDDPAEAEAYDWFAIRTGNAGDGDGDGLACE